MQKSSRAERRYALRRMAELADLADALGEEFHRMARVDSSDEEQRRAASIMDQINKINEDASRSSLFRPYSEADWIDKVMVFFSGNRRDIALVVVTSILAALVTWLVATGQFVGILVSVFGGIFGAAPAIAADPGLLLSDRQAMGSAVAMIAAVVVGFAFTIFSVSWFFTKNAAKRKEARDFLTLIVTFFVGILTGWAL